MTGNITMPLGLGCPELRGVAHPTGTAKTSFASALDDYTTDSTSVAPYSSQGEAGTVDDRMARGADRFAIAKFKGKIGVSFPCFDVMGVQVLRGPAPLAGIVVPLKDGIAPLLVPPGTPPVCGQGGLIKPRCQIATFIAAILGVMPTTLFECLSASLAGKDRRRIPCGSTCRRTTDNLVAWSRYELLTANRAGKSSARITDAMARGDNSEGLATYPALANECVGLHGRIIPHFRALERLAGMGLEPRLLDGC